MLTDLNQAQAAIATAKNISTRLGAPLPAALTDELDRLEALRGKGERANLTADRAAAAAAIWDALDRDEDPTTDPDVMRFLAIHNLQTSGVLNAMPDVIERRRARAITTHADAVIATWTKAAQKAEKLMKAARETLPGIDFEDHSASTGLPPHQMSAWAQGRDALSQVQTLTSAWVTLVTATQRRPVTHPALIVADLDLEQYESVNPSRPYLAATHAPIALATREEHAERVAAIEEAKADREAAHRRQREQDRSLVKLA